MILSYQLIAALLNIASGSAVGPVSATISDARAAIGAGPLPLKVSPSSALGQRMVADAQILDAYNLDPALACRSVSPFMPVAD